MPRRRLVGRAPRGRERFVLVRIEDLTAGGRDGARARPRLARFVGADARARARRPRLASASGRAAAAGDPAARGRRQPSTRARAVASLVEAAHALAADLARFRCRYEGRAIRPARRRAVLGACRDGGGGGGPGAWADALVGRRARARVPRGRVGACGADGALVVPVDEGETPWCVRDARARLNAPSESAVERACSSLRALPVAAIRSQPAG